MIIFIHLKIYCYILLLGLSVFFAEELSIPYFAAGDIHENSCHMKTGMKPASKKSCCSHDDKKSTACMDCPMCFVSLATPAYTGTILVSRIKKITYGIFQSRPLATFCNITWKPPDTGLI
jgi:hypothetical protein